MPSWIDGQRLLAEEEYADAVEVYRALSREHPNDVGYLLGLTEALAGAGDIADAIRHARSALRICPDDPRCHFALGTLLRKNHRYAESVLILDRAFALEEAPRVRSELVRALTGAAESSADVATAERYLARAQNLDPLNRDVGIRRMGANLQAQNVGAARALYSILATQYESEQDLWADLHQAGIDANWVAPNSAKLPVRRVRGSAYCSVCGRVLVDAAVRCRFCGHGVLVRTEIAPAGAPAVAGPPLWRRVRSWFRPDPWSLR